MAHSNREQPNDFVAGTPHTVARRGVRLSILSIGPLAASAVLILLWLVACTRTIPEDVSKTDSAAPDSAAPDSAAPDSTAPDSVAPDSQSDRELVDSGVLPIDLGMSFDEIDDPSNDGWQTEAFSAKAQKQVKVIGEMIAGRVPIEVDNLAPLVMDDFSCSPLIPPQRQTVFEDRSVKIERPAPVALGDSNEHDAHRGASGLATALRELAAPFREATGVRYKFKLFRITPQDDLIATTLFVAISGQTARGILEQNATWSIHWIGSHDKATPRMARLQLEDFEQAAGANSAGPMFRDCTQAVLGHNACYETQLLHGFNHWVKRMHQSRYFQLFGTPGVAVGDVNGDGLEDLYLSQEGGLPNRLFLQNPDGTATEVSVDWGVDWLEDSRSALLVDLDNDGDQDLVVAMLGGVLVAENVEQQQFRFRDLLTTTDDTMSLAAADYDQDGRLDLYVCCYYLDQMIETGESTLIPSGSSHFVFHNANDGGPSHLFRNGAGNETAPWQWTDVTAEVGLNANNHRWSFAASWEDYDNDGDQDLYVANDYGRDNLYRNDGGQFVDVAATAGAEDSAGGMGLTWADYDRDGWMDVHVSNMFSAAGNRVTFQPGFKPGAPLEFKKRLQRFARGNSLLTNQGDGTFLNTAAAAGIEMGRWAWASKFCDLNNDSWEDVVVANGYLTTEDTGDL